MKINVGLLINVGKDGKNSRLHAEIEIHGNRHEYYLHYGSAIDNTYYINIGRWPMHPTEESSKSWIWRF